MAEGGFPPGRSCGAVYPSPMPSGDPGAGDRGGPSLAFRAVLAVGLTVAFYAFALGLSALLLWLAWMNATRAKHVQVQFLLFCIVGAGAILWSVLPRIERFEAPGPRLLPGSQPRLFRELQGVADAVGQEMPAEVYLVADLNAGVLQRGGLLGFGGRRVMILGLPLLTVLRVSEFRAVLAHEFGHYHGGETRLGPWIHRTQSAVVRTVRSLEEAGSLLRFVFLGYAKLFFRITHAVSRRQELAADRLAAGVSGAPALAAGLRGIHGADPALGAYFGQELFPVLASGFRPPVAEGFHRFLQSRAVRTAVDDFLENLVREQKGDPYDTHPPLRERLAALGNPGLPAPDPGDPEAVALLEGLPDLEGSLVAAMFPGMPGKPEAMDWAESGEKVFLPRWRNQVGAKRDVLRGLTPLTLPGALSRRAAVGSRWRRLSEAPSEPGGPPPLIGIVGAAMVLLLVDRGWTLACEPGAEVSVTRGSTTFLPFREISDLAAGSVDEAAWGARCRETGIADVPLESADPGPESK